jgi:hypothetical protein
MVFDPSGFANKRDRVGDTLLRTFDDGILRQPLKTALHHPQMFLERLTSGPKRYRGEVNEVAANATRLGLQEYYRLTAQGVIEVTPPEIFTRSINLQDMYRVDAPVLQELDRSEALRAAGAYIRQIHEQHGAIGEVHTSDFFFQKKEGNRVSEPLLGLPDIVYNPDKYSAEQLRTLTEPRAVDILDFLMVVATEELRKTGNWEMARRGIESVLQGYADTKVIAGKVSPIVKTKMDSK